jgi:hypothetical protein
MALLFVDSCDHIHSRFKWNKRLNAFDDGEGKPGRTGLAADATGNGSYAWRTDPWVLPTVCFGAASRWSGIPVTMMRLFNPIATYNRLGITLNLNTTSDGRLYCVLDYSPWGGPLSSTTQPVITQGEWYYFELWGHIYHVPGPGSDQLYCDVKVRVNEELVIDETIAGYIRSGGYVIYPGQEGWTSVGVTGGIDIMDDVYVTDGEFLGDIRIYTIRPNAPGDESDWGAYGASSLWQATLNPGFERGSGMDSSYARAYSSDVGKSFLVNFQDIEPLGPIMGLQVNYVNTKSNPGSAAFVPRMKISGSIYEHSKTIYPSWGSWYDRVVPLRKNPVTGENWTVADVNSIQAGARRTL